MKIRFMTKRQLAAEKAQLKAQHIARGELLKLTGRLLTVAREARDYLKSSGCVVSYTPDSRVLSYNDLMARLNSLLDVEERKAWNKEIR